jgi:hypothetical protein
MATVERRTAGALVRPGFMVAMLLATSACGLLGKRTAESPQAVAARASADARIRAEVAARLAAEPSLAGSRIRVEVAAGEVALFGSVPGMGALRCAETNVELVEGVHLVIDHMELTSGPPQVPCLAPRVFAAGSPRN